MENGINQNVFTDIYHQLKMKPMNLSRNNLIIIGSYLWFIIAMLFCYTQNHHASALSVFGLNSHTKFIFGSTLVTLALVTLYFQETFNFKNLTKKWLVVAIRYGSIISSISLMIVAFIDMNSPIHYLFAAIYFILMPQLALIFGFIYWFAGDRTISKYLFIISISNFVISFILFTFVKSYLVAEVVHSHFVFGYVYLISKQK